MILTLEAGRIGDREAGDCCPRAEGLDRDVVEAPSHPGEAHLPPIYTPTKAMKVVKSARIRRQVKEGSTVAGD